MPDLKQFRLPDVGEGLTEAEIVTWKVKPGDTVRTNDIVVEIETAKSLVELPTPFAGVVAELLVRRGHDRRRRHADHLGGRRPDGLGGPARRGRRRGRLAPRRGAAGRGRGCDRGRDGARGGRDRARPDRRSGPGRAHVGAGRLRPADDVRQAPSAQGQRRHVQPRRASSPSGTAASRSAGWSPRSWPRRPSCPPVEPHRAPHADLPGHLGHDEQPVAHARRWPSRRSASWPRTSASTWRRCRRPARTGSSPARTCRRTLEAAPSRPPSRRRRAAAASHRAGRARDAGADQGRAQDDRAGDGRLGVHRAARHRVRDGRRRPAR